MAPAASNRPQREPTLIINLSDFYLPTSVPLVFNTSFNENEPVVCRPEEALDCFLRTKMDVLVLGSFFVERRADHRPTDCRQQT